MMRLRTIGCKLKPPQRVKIRQPEKRVDSFYNSHEWRALIDGIIRQRGRYCQDPQHDRTKPRTGRIYGDHVVELKDGGAPLDPANIFLRCASCHTKKTMIERAKRYHGGAWRRSGESRDMTLAPGMRENLLAAARLETSCLFQNNQAPHPSTAANASVPVASLQASSPTSLTPLDRQALLAETPPRVIESAAQRHARTSIASLVKRLEFESRPPWLWPPLM